MGRPGGGDRRGGAGVGGTPDRRDRPNKVFLCLYYSELDGKIKVFAELGFGVRLTGLISLNRSCLTDRGFGIDFELVIG
jgi:hypothetical protein